jgi:small ligand-binding sensory domain FIST
VGRHAGLLLRPAARRPGQPRRPGAARDLGSRLPGAFLNGGLTSSNFQNHQAADGHAVSGGLSGVLLGPGAPLVTDHTQGCLLFGTPHKVTGARKNLVETLDHKRAVDTLKAEVGEPFASDPQKIGGRIFAALPIGGSDTGDYLVRNILALDMGGGGVAIGDYVEEGARLQFCRRDPEAGREDMARMLARLRKRVGDQAIRGGVYFSCLGRGRHQFGEDAVEVGLIREALGDFPLLGFFANGEIYNGRIYGYTGVLTLFL